MGFNRRKMEDQRRDAAPDCANHSTCRFADLLV